jgi:periplasmic divalent cation tolerance protein
MRESSDGGAARVVWITAPDREVALRLARGLVERRLAACAQVLPGLTSVYRWQGAVQEESEVLLLVKSTAARLDALEAWVREAHPYDTPECLALAPERVEPRYLAWLEEACADVPPER